LVWSDANGVIYWCRPNEQSRALIAANSTTRSARVAISPTCDRIALLTDQNMVMLINAASAAEERRWQLPEKQNLDFQWKNGGLIFADTKTLIVVSSELGIIRKIEL